MVDKIEQLHMQVGDSMAAVRSGARAFVCIHLIRGSCTSSCQVDADIEELAAAKAAIKENERLQMEERAEAAAQRMLLEEDAELRKAIQVRTPNTESRFSAKAAVQQALSRDAGRGAS
jgi:hypothetical protein